MLVVVVSILRLNTMGKDNEAKCLKFLFSASMGTDQAYITLDKRFAKDEDPDDIEYNYAIRSMLVLFYDHLTLAATWLCKACLLIILYRLT